MKYINESCKQFNYTRHTSSCLCVGYARSPQSHSYLCSWGLTPLPPLSNSNYLGYIIFPPGHSYVLLHQNARVYIYPLLASVAPSAKYALIPARIDSATSCWNVAVLSLRSSSTLLINAVSTRIDGISGAFSTANPACST